MRGLYQKELQHEQQYLIVPICKKFKILKKREKFGGYFFTDRGGFNCSAYQHPRRDKYTVAGEKK
jgi:hypothetical protein